MPTTKRSTSLAVKLLVALLAVVLVVAAYIMLRPSPTGSTSGVGTYKGNLACLPPKGTGPVTLECAIGLKTADGTYYRLLGLSQADSATSTTSGVTITGTLEPAIDGSKYGTAGTIHVKTFKVD